MKRYLPAILPILLAAPTGATDDPYASIKDLGSLNGIALSCKYIGEVRRMKAAVIAAAPKERSYGIAFDEATNAGFLAFVSAGKPCPGEAGFAEQVDQAIDQMRSDLTSG